MRKILSLIFLGVFSVAAPLFSLKEEVEAQSPVNVEVVAENMSVEPGSSTWLALHFKLDPTWHIYWKNPGDSGAPISVLFDLPKGFKLEEIKWPTPHRFELEGFVGLGYEDEVTLLAKISTQENINISQDAHIKAIMQWVACSNECVPHSVTIEKDLKVSRDAPLKDEKVASIFEKARQSLPLAHDSMKVSLDKKLLDIKFSLPQAKGDIEELNFYPETVGLINLSAKQQIKLDQSTYTLSVPLEEELQTPIIKGVLVGKFASTNEPISLEVNSETVSDEVSSTLSLFAIALLAAFAGGALLNLMPCVLPVLSLKVLSIVQAAGECCKERFRQGFAYVVGVVVSFWALTSLLLILRASGSELGWGFQLQEPIFVGMLALLLFLMALNFFGVFEMGSSLISLDQGKQKSSKLLGAFFSGVLATIVATPCTGPFLGAALGFAMTLPWYGTFTLFTVMALGMAIPFFLLTAYPKLLKFLPKPGNWMIMLKQVFGFILVLTTLWLIWVFEAQTSFMSVMWLLIALVVISFGAWLYGHFGGFNVAKRTRIVMKAVCLGIAVSAITLVSTKAIPSEAQTHVVTQDSNWEPFSTKRLEELRQSGKPVFIDFTAKWCLLCQANKAVLHSKEVDAAFEKAGIVKLDADWTRGDPEITRLLKEFGRTGVPLYVLYGNDKEGKPYIFAETLTQEMLVEATSNVY
jgi:thiol:disulfide interchange protein